MQVIKSRNRISLALFNIPNCVRKNVDEGKENAGLKASHCSLLRCPGVGMCADPLTCAPTLYPNSNGVYRFRPAWRAREKEMLLLAMRNHEKKTRARRSETLRNTSLCKVIQSIYDANVACRMLQIDLRRWFRTAFGSSETTLKQRVLLIIDILSE